MNKFHAISTNTRQLLVATAVSICAMLLVGAAPAQAQENYSYTVQSGDGVTNLILDLAETNDKDITPARAYQIAKNNGQKFLDNNLTIESDLPYTEGVGAFEDVGVTIAASDNQQLFDDLVAAINDSPAANDDDIEVPAEDEAESDEATAEESDNDKKADDKDAEGDDDSDEEDEDEETADSDNIWPWIIGIAAVLGGLYYINSSRNEE